MTAPATPRHILVVEDDADYRTWLCAMLFRCLPEARVIDTATLGCARRALSVAAGTLELALIDLGLPDGSGIDLIRQIAAHHAHIAPVVTTIFDDDATLFQALAAGAQGYVLKDADEAEVMDHLLRIRAGTPPISPAIARRLLAHFHAAPLDAAPLDPPPDDDAPRLTRRELDVLRCIGRGLRVAETARLLELSENTVAGYVKTLYRKLNVSSRAEVAIEAARRGLL